MSSLCIPVWQHPSHCFTEMYSSVSPFRWSAPCSGDHILFCFFFVVGLFLTPFLSSLCVLPGRTTSMSIRSLLEIPNLGPSQSLLNQSLQWTRFWVISMPGADLENRTLTECTHSTLWRVFGQRILHDLMSTLMNLRSITCPFHCENSPLPFSAFWRAQIVSLW